MSDQQHPEPPEQSQLPPEQSLTNRLINVGLGLVLVAVLGFNIWHYLGRQDPPHPLQGKAAPEFTLPQLASDGASKPPLALSGLRGKVVLLDFWATYCGPCKKQMPILQELHKELPPEKFAIVSVNTDHPRLKGRQEIVASFVKKGGYQFPIVLDDGNAMSSYQVKRIPTLVFVAPDGTIHHAHTGLSSREELMEQVEELLNAPDNS